MNNIETERMDSLEGWVAVKSNIFEEAEAFKLGFIVQWNVIECKFAVTCHNRTLQRQRRKAEVTVSEVTVSEVTVSGVTGVTGETQVSWAGLFSVSDLKHVHQQFTCVADILLTCFPDLSEFEAGNIWDLLFLTRRSGHHGDDGDDDDERDFDASCRRLEKYFSTAIDVCGRKIVLDTLFTQDERDVEEYFENLQEFKRKTMQKEMSRAKGQVRQALQTLAKKHPNVISVIRLDVTDLHSIKQCAQHVGSLVGKGGLNLLINNAGVLNKAPLQETSPEDMQYSFKTNCIGPMNIIKEFLPHLRDAAKASGIPGMSCSKAAVVSISSVLSSMEAVKESYGVFSAVSYRISKVSDNLLTL